MKTNFIISALFLLGLAFSTATKVQDGGCTVPFYEPSEQATYTNVIEVVTTFETFSPTADTYVTVVETYTETVPHAVPVYTTVVTVQEIVSTWSPTENTFVSTEVTYVETVTVEWTSVEPTGVTIISVATTVLTW
jgi:hypothetical protein